MAVAYSGGRDSTALLHATASLAAPMGLRVVALHIHHGLNPAADAWLAHCEARCAAWAAAGLPIECRARRLSGRPAAGDSVEAWAREQRHRALREMALQAGAAVVLLGHHRRDQAETFLLQALRGAGVAGLAGMPRSARRDGITWLRPWIDRPRGEIEAYLLAHGLDHVDDDSNDDPRFARNRLRLHVWPGLTNAFPQAEASIAAAAVRAQQADAALQELAAIDLASVAPGAALDRSAWLLLSTARRSLALRAWLKDCIGRPATAALVTRLLDELPSSRSGARWPLGAGGGELRQHRGLLRFHVRGADVVAGPPEREAALSVRRAGTYALPGWGGRLKVTRVRSSGVPLARLAQLEVRRRDGSERFQAGPGRPPRSLKKQFQTADVPAWARDGPLFFSDGRLVYVPGLGLDARIRGSPGEAMVELTWLPHEGVTVGMKSA